VQNDSCVLSSGTETQSVTHVVLCRTAFSVLGNLGSVRPIFVAVEADIYRERVITIIGTVAAVGRREGRLGMTAWRFLSIQC